MTIIFSKRMRKFGNRQSGIEEIKMFKKKQIIFGKKNEQVLFTKKSGTF